jgi:hypothetical protein
MHYKCINRFSPCCAALNDDKPEVPSAKEISENGHNIGEMNMILLKKVEELTLYIIEQQKEINLLKQEIMNSKSE